MIFKRVSIGVMLPWWLGVVYIDCYRNEAVACPIPLNLIIRFFWLMWLWLRCPLPIFDREKHNHEKIKKLKKEIKTLRQFAEQQHWEKMINEPFWRTS